MIRYTDSEIFELIKSKYFEKELKFYHQLLNLEKVITEIYSLVLRNKGLIKSELMML